jgi:hypothetical protein
MPYFSEKTALWGYLQNGVLEFAIFSTSIQIPPPKRANPGPYLAPTGSGTLVLIIENFG